jgi:hypothetical protein
MIRPLGVVESEARRASSVLTPVPRSERSRRRLWVWLLALALVAIAVAFLPDVASAQDACGVNICKPDYDPMANDAPYSQGTMEFIGALLLGAFLVWAVVTESIGFLWWSW